MTFSNPAPTLMGNPVSLQNHNNKCVTFSMFFNHHSPFENMVFDMRQLLFCLNLALHRAVVIVFVCIWRHYRCHELSLYLNRVCTGQSSDSERASAEWQSAAVTPQFNVHFSFGSRIAKHLIEFIAIES